VIKFSANNADLTQICWSKRAISLESIAWLI